MGVDAHVARTGLKMKTTLHTSTMAQGKIQMQDGRIFNLDIKPPQDNTQVIFAENKFFIIHRGEEREQMMAAEKVVKEVCSSDGFATITGLEVCAKVSLPWADKKASVPWFMLWGPSSASVIINKRDTHDSYRIEAKYIRNKGRSLIADNIRFYMDTPGARTNRKLLIDFTLDRNAKELSFILDTPWKKASLRSGVINEDELKRLFAVATIDEREYSINAELATVERSYTSQYTPKIEISTPGKQTILLTGDVKYRPGRKAVFTMTLKNLFREPIKASGTVIMMNQANQMRYATDFDFSSPVLIGKVSAFVDNTRDEGRVVSSKLDLEYTYKNNRQQNIHFEQTVNDLSRHGLFSYIIDSSWSTTLAERYNGDVHVDWSMNGESMTTRVNAGFDQERRITLTQTAVFHLGSEHKINIGMSVLFPYMNIDYTGELRYLRNSNDVRVSGTVKCCVDKEGTLEISAKRNSRTPLSVIGEAKLIYPGFDMAVSGSLEESPGKVYRQNLNVRLQKQSDIQVSTIYKMEPRHELTTDIIIPDVPKITIKGYLKPDINNFQAGSEVSYKGKAYKTGVNWMHRGNSRNFNTQAGLEVAYPKRLITAEGSATGRGSEITSTVATKWDANNDEMKQFAMSSKINVGPSNPAVDLQISVYPRHFINLKANGKYETGGWYKSDSDVEGSVRLQSSFENFEDIKASFRHDRTPKVYKNSADISWARNRKITGEVNLKKKQGSWANSEIAAVVTTPFDGARRMSTEIGYKLEDTRVSTNAKGQIDDKQVTLGFAGELNIPQHRLSGDLSFTSPFAKYESITATLQHSDDGETYHSSMATRWAPDKQITADFDMQHKGSLFSAVNSGTISVSTPFPEYRRAKAMWQHQHNANTLKNAIQVERQDSSVYSHNAVINLRKTNRRFVAGMQASLKASNINDVSFSMEHSHDRQNMEILKSDYSLSWAPEKTVALSVDLDRSGNKLLWATGNFRSPFEGFESITLKTNTNKNGNAAVSSNEIQWADNKRIALESEVILRGYEFQVHAELSTPLQNVKTLVINAENRLQDGVWATHADVDYGKRIELDTELEIGPKKMITLRLTSPCPYVRDLFAKAEMNGGIRNFDYGVEIRHDRMANKIKMNGVINTADLKKMQVTTNLRTPFEVVRFLKINVNQIIEDGAMHLDGTIEHPSYKAKITEDLSYRWGQFVNSKATVEYRQGRIIELEADLRIKPKMSAKISWKSPFENYEDIVLTVNHEVSATGFSTNGELNYSPRDKINVNLDYIRTGNAITGSVQITTPFTQMKRIALVVNHEGSLTTFRNDASLEIDSIRISGKSEFTLKGGEMEAKIELQTPIQNYETITAEITHKGSLTNFQNIAILTAGGKQLSSNVQVRIRPSMLSGSLELLMPFDNLRSVEIIIDHSGSLTNFNNKLIMAYNDRKIVSKSQFRITGSTVNGKISIKSPYAWLRSMIVQLRHEGLLSDFRNSLKVTLNDKDLSADSQLALAGNTLSATGSISLPGLVATLAVNHNGPATDFRNDATILYNGVSYRGESEFSKRGDVITGKLTGRYPSRVLSGEIKHRGTMTNFNNDVTLMYGDKKITGSSKFKLIGDAMTAEGSLEMPQNSMSVVASHEGPADNFRNGFNLQYNGKRIRGSSELSLVGSNLALKALLNTPYRILRSASIDFTHSGSLSNFNNNAMVNINNKQITGNSQLRLAGDRLNAKAVLQMPETRVVAEINHAGKPTNFKNDAKFAYNGQQVSGNSEFRWRQDGVSLTGVLQTPSNTLSADLSHSGTWMNFNNNGAISFNGKRLSGSSSLNRYGDNLSGKATVESPSNNMMIEVNHRGPVTDFASDVSLSYNKKRTTGSVLFKMQDDKLNGKVTMRLPSDADPSVQLEVNHEGGVSNFRNDFNMQYGGRSVSGNGQFKYRNDRLYAKGELNMPTSSVKHVVGEVVHSGGRRNFENTFELILGDDNIKGGSQFYLQGNTLTTKANLQTTYGMKPVSIEIDHSGPPTRFTDKIMLSYGDKKVMVTSEFRLEGNNMILKANFEPLFCCMNPISLDIIHTGQMTSFTNRAIAKYGSREISLNNDFNINSRAFHLITALRTNIENVKPISIEVSHEGPLTDCSSNALISYGDDRATITSEFKLQGSVLHFKITGQTTFGDIKPISIEISHSGPINNFVDSIILIYGNKEIVSNLQVEIDGKTVTVDVKLETPFRQAQILTAKFIHNWKSWRNFENRGTLKVNDRKYAGQSEFRWFGKIFKLYAEINVPDEYGIKINHKGIRTDFSNNLKITIPGEKITGTSSFKMNENKMEGRASLDSTMRSLNGFDAAFTHEGDGRKFKSSFDLQTPFRGYKSFSGELNHEGTMNNFRTTGTLNLPFQEVRNIAVTANHQTGDDSFNTAASVSYDNKAISGAVNYKKTDKKLTADANIQTPYSRYENLAASVEHSGTGNNFQTKGTITTSIPGYERFSGMLSHRGDMNQFNTIAEVTTPIRRYNKFGVNVEHTGNRRNFKTSGSLTTSIPNYDRFAGDVEYSYDGTNLHAVGNVHTPFARYDDFGMKLDHTGSYNGFRTSVEATSSIPGYDKFGATVEKKGTLKDFEVSSDIRTPFRNYQHFGTGIKYSGEPMNFRTSGHVTTSVPGYEKVSGSLSHNGNLKAFTSNAEIKTPFPGHEVYTMAIDHNYNSGISTSASLEYPGKKYAFNLNHQGTANNFNSNLDIQTPHPGYEQFGLSVVHSGDLKDMTQSGTIRLPFRKIPEIKYTISHRGNLRDFTSSATVEYNREKIEGEWNYKHTSSWGEENYEGGATITSTHNQLRDFRLTAKHTRKSREKSGMLDIIYNNQQTVDMDYEYTTSGDKIINIKIRQPQPFETRINFHSDGKQINGDAYLSWNTMFTAKGELNMKNLANDREIDLKLVLPSRTISLKSDYKLSDSALAHSTDLQWGNEATKKLSYTLEASKTSRRGQTIIDGRFSIQSSQINGEATLSHISIPGRQCTTEVAVQTSKRMAIKSDLTIDSSRFQHTLTIEHPEIRRAASITTEGSVNGDSYDGKIELQYNREVLTLAGKLTDESTSTMQKLAAGFKVAHPRSGLDLQLSTDLENNDEMTTVYAEAKYLMATDRQYKISSLRAEINKLRKELNIEIVSPIDTFHVAGRLVSSSNGVSQYSGEAKCDHNEMRGELSVVSGKSVDLKIHYNHNDFLQATAKASPEQVKAEVFRMVSGDKIQEVLLMLQKDDERLVSGRTYWRPAIYREIKAAVEDNRFERQHKASWNRFVDEVKEEYSLRADYLKKNAKPFYKALVSIQKDIVSTFKDVKSELISMYNNNEFHLRDIRNYMLQVKEWSGSAYTTMKKSATDNYTKAKAVLIRSRRSLDEITDQAWNYTQELAKRLSDWWQNQDWSDIKEKIQDNARDIADQFSNHPTIRRFITKVEAYMQGDAVATSGSAPSLWDKLMSRDDVQTGISYIKKRVTDSDVANKYFEVKKTIDGIMEDVHKNGLKAVRANLVAWLKNYLRTDKDSFTVGDGDLEFSLYVPLPLDDLRSMPKVDINFSKYLRQARDLVNSYMPKYDWTLWDYYYYYKPSSNIRDMIPPFKGHATISGNQHYMTFDKKFYEFSGDCSYLLARDFIDGTFSVIVNYERTAGRPVRKSIIVMINDKKIVISGDGSVMMDNARVEMPVEMAGITILRDENQITVNNKNGVKITCDLAHDQCSVDVSGWYYSKTGGLLGTYNNEQVDDFTSVDRERLQNVGQFAASWSVGTRCRPTNSAVDVSNEVAPESRRYDICAKYFKYESSPFRRCFKVVDPKPFMKMCLNSMPTNVNHMETDEDTCNTAAFYVKECQRVEVPIRIPGLCVRCAMENGQIFSEGQNVTIKDEEVPSSADVVFIIHHHECNKMMLDNLKNIVDNLEKVFKLEQITNNRYAILGYGGPGIRGPVHIHTMDGQVFATRDKILLGLENFHTTSGEIEDAMAAVKYATNLPFRVGVSKNIVLLPCAPCRQGQATFSELQQLLLFRDINFHVLMQYNFLFKGNKNAGTAYIFGVDRETVYTRKDAGTTELVGDSEIRSHILMPKDLCVALSEETDGSVFNTLQYINSRPFIQKRFMDVLVRVIADKAEPSECQICDCRPDNVGAGKADCRHCVRPDPIYDIMPRFDSILLPPPAFETPEAPGLKPNVPKSVKTPKKAKKSKAKKSKKQLNAKKRAMRERRLRRLEQQQS